MTVELFDLALELDEERLQERNGRTLADEDRGGGWLGARVACALVGLERMPGADGARQRVRIALQCIVHPNPSCLVARLEMIASLSPSAQLRIVEMRPQSAMESYRVSEKGSREAGLGTALIPVSTKATEERTSELQVRSWAVAASGIGTARAKWSFEQHVQAPIPPEHALGIDLDCPADPSEIEAEFYIAADLRREGGLSKIPYIGRRKVQMSLASVL